MIERLGVGPAALNTIHLGKAAHRRSHDRMSGPTGLFLNAERSPIEGLRFAVPRLGLVEHGEAHERGRDLDVVRAESTLEYADGLEIERLGLPAADLVLVK